MPNYLGAFLELQSLVRRAYWDHQRLEEHQNKRLRKIVRYAYECVPFYHRELKQLGIRPEDIKTIKDLDKLPILRKDAVRKNLNDMISVEFIPRDLKKLSTSGSTGQPLFLYISEKEDEFRKAKHLRANISLGQQPRDRWVTITSPHHFGNTTKLQRLLGVYTPTFVSIFDDVSRQVSTIERMRPDILDGYSSSLLLLAKELKTGENTVIRPRFIIGGAELIDDSSRRFVEEAFAAPFYDQYASVELERIAWQCPLKSGYHIDADAIIVEFVDGHGNEISEEERGEIICTSLFNYSMPLIRYAVGDIGVPSNETCPCGRTLPLMKSVEGRKDSLLFLPDGRILTPRALTIALNMFELYNRIEKFRVIQTRMDRFELQIKLGSEETNKDNFEKALIAHIRRMLRVDTHDVTFEVRFVDDIPLDKSGKFSMVVSRMNKNPGALGFL